MDRAYSVQIIEGWSLDLERPGRYVVPDAGSLSTNCLSRRYTSRLHLQGLVVDTNGKIAVLNQLQIEGCQRTRR